MIPGLIDLLKHNNFATGGFVLMVFGGVIAALRNLPRKLIDNIKARTILNVSITSDDSAFDWIEHWVTQQAFTKKTRTLRLSAVKDFDDDDDAIHEPNAKAPKVTPYVLIPGNGEHMIRYHDSYVWLSIDREKLQLAGNNSSKLFVTTMTLRMFRGSRELLERLIAEAYDLYNNRFETLTKVWTCNYNNWSVATYKVPRPPESLILPSGTLADVRDDLSRFYSRRAWYMERGIPYRRGYLLHGPPGNSKSSLVQVLAASLGRDVAMLSLASRTMSDDNLQTLLQNTPKNAILCLEDVDAAFTGRDKKEENSLSFSGLLNALDGIAAVDGRVIFMTTNHKQVLDPALIRPGRADKHLYIGNATPGQATDFFLRFFPAEVQLAQSFAGQVVDGDVSMAALQEHLIQFEADARLAAVTPLAA